MRSWLPLLSLIAGCEPAVLHVPGQPWDSDPDHPTVPIDEDLVGARIVESGIRACPVPSDRDRLGPYQKRISPGSAASQAYLWAGGLLAGDLDDDGFLDLITPAEVSSQLFRGSSDGRMDLWDQRLSAFDLTMGTGGSLADGDGDGDLDVLILRYEQPAVMLRNEGHGTFSNVSSNMDIATGPTTSSAWGDIDADGDLDLFIGSYGYLGDEGRPARSYLFENAGDGTFFNRSDELPEILHQGYTRVGGFHDIDGDSLPELYVVNDVGSVAPNILLRNIGGKLLLDHNASGLDLAMSGGGLGVGDVNGDDRPDFLIPQWDELSLMVSGEGGLWFDHAPASGLRPAGDQRVGWGAELADVDNDGDLDGIVAYGEFEVDDEDGLPGNWQNPTEQPDALFLQDEHGNFEDVAPEWGVDDPGKNRGFVIADFDDDGWLDIVKRDLDGPSVLYVSRCGREHWLKVRLSDPGILNRFVVGAQVRVVAEDGRHWSRWVTAGGTGFGSGGPPEVHFGLGDVDRIDRLEVRWPDGTESWVGFGASTDQTVTVFRE